jgi:hypothetical protein
MKAEDEQQLSVTIDYLKNCSYHLRRAKNCDSVIYDTRQRNELFSDPHPDPSRKSPSFPRA